ncbi:MAG: hypothetical protein FIA97_18085 [Methylococcaceae bacterium]|nr:hypothetical protein [Methylococcaceae bacterium]
MLLAGALLTIQPATAAPVSTSATIDWSTFSVTPLDIGSGLPSLTWNSQSDSSSANSGCNWWGCNSNTDSANDWSTGTSVLFNTSTSKFNASATGRTSTSLVQSSTAFDAASPTNTYWNNSDNASRSGNFTVHGDGVLLFKANYNIAATAAGGISDSSSSNMSASFALNAYGGESSGSSSQNISRYLSSGQSPLAESGTLTVALLFHDGWTGSFSANTSSSLNYYGYGGGNPVPLPSAFWAFASALSGMISFLRRKRGMPGDAAVSSCLAV